MPRGNRHSSILLMAACLVGAMSVFLRADEAPAPDDDPVPRPQPIETPSVGEFDEAIAAGVEFLLADQNPNGSWGSATRTKFPDLYAPIPGAHEAFRAAVTALDILALYEVGGRYRRNM